MVAGARHLEQVWIARGRAKGPRRGPLEIALGIPTFVGDDVEAMRNAARANLALFTTFPFSTDVSRERVRQRGGEGGAGRGGDSYSDRMPVIECSTPFA